MDIDGVHALMLREVKEHGSQKAWADALGVSPSHISDILSNYRRPSRVVLDALGLEIVVDYRRKK